MGQGQGVCVTERVRRSLLALRSKEKGKVHCGSCDMAGRGEVKIAFRMREPGRGEVGGVSVREGSGQRNGDRKSDNRPLRGDEERGR